MPGEAVSGRELEEAVPQDGQIAAVSGISLPHRSHIVIVLYPISGLFFYTHEEDCHNLRCHRVKRVGIIAYAEILCNEFSRAFWLLN